MSILGRPIQNPQPAPKVRVVEYFDKKTGIKSKWYYDYDFFPNGPYKTEHEYPTDFKSDEEMNESLPKTKRKYLNEKNGKMVGYGRAVQLGIIK